MGSRMRVSLVVSAGLLFLLPMLGACSSSTPTTAPSVSQSPSLVDNGLSVYDAFPEDTPIDYPAVVIDVRTPENYASGHLKGAVNLPLRDKEMFSSVISTLGTGSSYEVYGQTSKKSAQAVVLLKAAGLTVRDLGSLDEAGKTTELPIVKN